MEATFYKYRLQFKQASGTSRGVLRYKETYLIKIVDNGKVGYGETGLFKGLSFDDVPDYEEKLAWVCKHIHLPLVELLATLQDFPSIQFGVEQALLSVQSKDPFVLFESDFTKGLENIDINGLIWMGSKDFMLQQIKDKLAEGFTTLKLKIGAIDFESELELLSFIRSQFLPDTITLRVDANGAFTAANALGKLEALSKYHIHSIEQPIKQRQFSVMEKLCKETPIPIALDEELIGIVSDDEKKQVLSFINPQFIILKPSLIGGFSGANAWINFANELAIPYWITSALESNIGLNAISQYTYLLHSQLPQGLGTGALFTNNFDSPLCVKQGKLGFSPQQSFNISL